MWRPSRSLWRCTRLPRFDPALVQGLTNISAIAAGFLYSLAVGSDGSVWAWGDNYAGQLGDGATASRSIPALVQGLTNIIAIAAGGGHSVSGRRPRPSPSSARAAVSVRRAP